MDKGWTTCSWAGCNEPVLGEILSPYSIHLCSLHHRHFVACTCCLPDDAKTPYIAQAAGGVLSLNLSVTQPFYDALACAEPAIQRWTSSRPECACRPRFAFGYLIYYVATSAEGIPTSGIGFNISRYIGWKNGARQFEFRVEYHDTPKQVERQLTRR
jgi:hypothetical protein